MPFHIIICCAIRYFLIFVSNRRLKGLPCLNDGYIANHCSPRGEDEGMERRGKGAPGLQSFRGEYSPARDR